MELASGQNSLRFCAAWLGFLLLGAQGNAMPYPSPANGDYELPKRATEVCSDNSSRIPAGSWDSHQHVLDPVRYPLQPDAAYVPGVYTAWDHVLFENRIGCEHSVIVQPSIYGYDNSLVIDTLRAHGPNRTRAVVAFNASSITTTQLQQWDDLGVRGVRLNFQSTGNAPASDELKEMLLEYADIVRPFGWVIQLYIAMDAIPLIVDVIPTLGVRVVFDHFGDPEISKQQSQNETGFDPYSLDGFQSMVQLLLQGRSWVKISAAYRLSNVDHSTYSDLDPLITELLRVVPSRLVYGSDWPHTRFEGLDIKPWNEHLLDLTEGHEDARQKLFRDNPEALWSKESAS